MNFCNTRATTMNRATAVPFAGRPSSLASRRSLVMSAATAEPPKIKKLKGKVISTKMDKTVVVRVTRTFPHPKYGKRMQKTKNFYAHDEDNTCNEGDIVVVEASRPMSKLKRWTLKEVVEVAVKKE